MVKLPHGNMGVMGSKHRSRLSILAGKVRISNLPKPYNSGSLVQWDTLFYKRRKQAGPEARANPT